MPGEAGQTAVADEDPLLRHDRRPASADQWRHRALLGHVGV
ncbi:MAG: hypothetical protein AVDCRST_MAG49-4345 [uncultured Thermomicrobiales bacterium]|uniref:Uncharacterized protein n=1 Tax=uncultured Thermomicrobiales bacterium TaxID=1645740 RepID=A0A6J4VF54_9BACT|nr:MAG: hypothetical protein AVDCRST_MAG49-4345 [uncultured Thermomicrobiales bacterium]